MKRRKNILIKGKKYPCMEILYMQRNVMPKRPAVCVACYVTLPKEYNTVAVEYLDPQMFAHRNFSSIIYSFLIIPVCCEAEAMFIVKMVGQRKALEVI